MFFQATEHIMVQAQGDDVASVCVCVCVCVCACVCVSLKKQVVGNNIVVFE